MLSCSHSWDTSLTFFVFFFFSYLALTQTERNKLRTNLFFSPKINLPHHKKRQRGLKKIPPILFRPHSPSIRTRSPRVWQIEQQPKITQASKILEQKNSICTGSTGSTVLLLLLLIHFFNLWFIAFPGSTVSAQLSSQSGQLGLYISFFKSYTILTL